MPRSKLYDTLQEWREVREDWRDHAMPFKCVVKRQPEQSGIRSGTPVEVETTVCFVGKLGGIDNPFETSFARQGAARTVAEREIDLPYDADVERGDTLVVSQMLDNFTENEVTYRVIDTVPDRTYRFTRRWLCQKVEA